jgi:branched-chain amino acid transport system substrate-binding protein
MRLVQFDGNTWQPIGEVIESAFLGANSPDPASSH